MKKLNMFFLSTYFLFTIVLFLMPIINISILNYILIFLGVIGSILFIKNKDKINISKKFVIITLIISILFKLLFVLTEFDYGVISDYKTFFDNAVNISNNTDINSFYYSLFPYLYPYTFILGIFMKIFGSTYISVILLNIVLDLIGGFFLYKLLDRITNEKNKNLGTVLYLINPMNIIFISFSAPLILVNTGIIILFYLISYLNKKIAWISILLGILIGLFNTFRPILIILLIAIVIYTILKKYSYINLIIIIVLYFLTTGLMENVLGNIIGGETSFNSGWSIYVGSNIEHSGRWNIDDSEVFNSVLYSGDVTPHEAHSIMQEKGIDRYIDNGFNNIPLMVKKAHILVGDHAEYSSTEFTHYNSLDIELLIFILSTLYFTFIIVLNIYNSYILCKKGNIDYIVYLIFGLGLVAATLLVEVSPRYLTPIYPSIIIGACLIITKLDKK